MNCFLISVLYNLFQSSNTLRTHALIIHSKEMCDQRNSFTMCPLCDKFCDYWNLSSACSTARASHLFDNPATVFFSIFMALWGEYDFQSLIVGLCLTPIYKRERRFF